MNFLTKFGINYTLLLKSNRFCKDNCVILNFHEKI